MTAVETARSLLGVPWVHQGRSAATGIDCIGLLALALGVRGPLPDYGRDPHNGLLERHLEAHCGPPLPTGASLRAGDIVAMAYFGAVRHVGIVGDHPHGGLSLIHTDNMLGRVTEHALDRKWLRRVRQIYRVKP